MQAILIFVAILWIFFCTSVWGPNFLHWCRGMRRKRGPLYPRLRLPSEGGGGGRGALWAAGGQDLLPNTWVLRSSQVSFKGAKRSANDSTITSFIIKYVRLLTAVVCIIFRHQLLNYEYYYVSFYCIGQIIRRRLNNIFHWILFN